MFFVSTVAGSFPRLFLRRTLVMTSQATAAVLQSSHSSDRHASSDHHRLQFPSLPPEMNRRFKPGQMFKYQDALMKLPVPPLKQTLSKYLLSVQPLLTREEYERTREVTEQFGRPGGEGQLLQLKLMERARSHDNWLADWWLHVAYLGFRLPVAIHSSPAIGYDKQHFKDTNAFLKFATEKAIGIAKWNILILLEALPPDVYRKKPMCMSQFSLYSHCRIPGPSSDTQRKTPIGDSRHIIVMRNGHFFKLDVLYETPSGELALAPAQHIMGQLSAILEEASSAPPLHPVGALSSEHRDTWYRARERLREDARNRSSLDVIERAQFCLCLDKPHPLVDGGADQTSFLSFVARRMLHGNGSEFNSTNRWWDLSTQMVVGEDGGCGSILEHSSSDGPAAISVHPFVLELYTKHKYDVFGEQSPVDPALLRPAEKLEWNISPQTAQDIETAKENHDRYVNDTDVTTFVFKDFGKNFAKSVKVSPDGFIQNAIQLAYYKLYNHPTATYESGGTRWFKYGRTDTIRSATNAALAFVKAMQDSNVSSAQKAKCLLEAINAHSQYTNDAISGNAVDRHLLGLKLIANESGMETPAFFEDKAFTKSLHFCLSTSQVPVSDHTIFLCFGAVVEDGYGVCYNPHEKEVYFTVSCFRQHPSTDSLLFCSKLAESMNEMRDVLAVAHATVSSKL